MAIFIFPRDIAQEFRWRHRLELRKLRKIARNKQQAKPRDLKDRAFDKALDAAIDRDRD